MRDPWGLNERLFALWYPCVAAVAERAGAREIRAKLIGQARGRTLEIGAGSGLNLAHYTPSVTELVVTEPSEHMLQHLREQLRDAAPPVGAWQLVETGALELPFEDDSFDTVTGTYVHCTIPDPPAALAEIARVLKPGGRYLFLEHVRADDGTLLGRFQDLVEGPHTYIAAGCHPNRRFGALLEDSPLVIERAERGTMPASLPTVRPILLGSATAV